MSIDIHRFTGLTLPLLGTTLIFLFYSFFFSLQYDSKQKNYSYIYCHPDRDSSVDRSVILRPVSEKTFLSFVRVPICCFFSHLPSDSLTMFLCVWTSYGCLCPLSGGLFWILAGHGNLSFYKGLFEDIHAKGKHTHHNVHTDLHRCYGKLPGIVGEFRLGAVGDRHRMGDHPSFLFSCRDNRLLPPQK
jgi:hypothetical protein